MSAPGILDRRAADRVEVDGMSVPAHFGDPAAEYDAARHAVALAHRAGRALFRVTGNDRATFLQGMLTNDVAALTPGAGCRALFLDTKGHVRGVIDLWAGDAAIVAGCEPCFIEDVLPDLSRYILAADVQIADLRGDKSVLALIGPAAEETLRGAGVEPPEPSPHAHRAAQVAGRDVWLARTADLAAPGVEVHVPADSVDDVWAGLEEMLGTSPVCVGWSAAEALRVEAGVARIGHEISGEEFPQELRLDDAVDYEKGCYLGQETVARIHYRGQVNRLLGGLRADGPLPRGAELVSSDRRVGAITSTAQSPALGAIALAMVRREESEAGATVQVRTDGEVLGEARVVPLPIGG